MKLSTFAAAAFAVFGFAGAAMSTTLSNVDISSDVLHERTGLENVGDDFLIEANEIFPDIFVSAPLDMGVVDAAFVADGDLLVFDPIDVFEILSGTALDIAVSVLDDTISILYELSINDVSPNGLSDYDLAVATLTFDDGVLDTGILSAADSLFGEFADVKIYGATALAPVPLPAGLPLLLAGVGAFAWVKRQRKTPA